MSFVLYENGKEVGPVSDWTYITPAPQKVSGSVFGGDNFSKKVGRPNDLCRFVAPSAPKISATHSVVFEKKTVFEIKITQIQGLQVEAVVLGKKAFVEKT